MHVLSVPIKPVWTFAKGTRMADENTKERRLRKLFLCFPALFFFLSFFSLFLLLLMGFFYFFAFWVFGFLFFFFWFVLKAPL